MEGYKRVSLEMKVVRGRVQETNSDCILCREIAGHSDC